MQEGKLQVLPAFPTYICAYQWPNIEEFNSRLELELYKLRSRDPEGIYRSNAAGTWHSGLTVLKDCGPTGKQLGQMFFQLFSGLGDCHGGQKGGKYEMNLSAWAMMYRDGGYSTPHTHPNCHFSGVYYVRTGKAEEPKTMATGVKVFPGTIEFLDTRGGPNSQQVPGLTLQPALRMPPKPGLMLVFPAWLPHFVHPVVGADDRIAVSCNAAIRKYHLPSEEEKKDDPEPSHETGRDGLLDCSDGSGGCRNG